MCSYAYYAGRSGPEKKSEISFPCFQDVFVIWGNDRHTPDHLVTHNIQDGRRHFIYYSHYAVSIEKMWYSLPEMIIRLSTVQESFLL